MNFEEPNLSAILSILIGIFFGISGTLVYRRFMEKWLDRVFHRTLPMNSLRSSGVAVHSATNPIYEWLINTIKDYAIFILDSTGHVVTWNKGAQNLKGYEASEIIGSHFSRFYSEADVLSGKCDYELKEALAQGRFEDEGWRYRKDGSRFWANVIITTVRDPDGNPIGFSKITRDLSERQQALEELKRSESKLREAQSIALVGNWEWDLLSDKISWSDELFKIFNLDPKSFDPSFEGYLQRMPKSQRDSFVEQVHKTIETGIPFNIEYPFRRTDDGSTHMIHSKGRVVYNDEGVAVALRGTCQDITERKIIENTILDARNELEARVISRTAELHEALERETKAKEAKMQFLANMSHEIRTPMNAILGFSDLLYSKMLSEEQRYFLDRIKNNGDQLLRLIDDILDLSKFEAGCVPIENSSFSFSELIQDLVSTFSVVAKKKGIPVSVFFKTPIPETIYSDPFRLRQILTNLLGNSLKFTAAGSLKIHLSYDLNAKSQGQLHIDISDTGIGISSEDQAKLFKPFSQADSTIVRKFGGTGLGLVLSRSIAKSMNGELHLLRSEPGVGSVFRLTLKMDQHAHFAATNWITHLHKKTSNNELLSLGSEEPNFKAHILLAEDSPDNQTLIRLYLDSPNIRLDIAQNGFEAVEMTQKQNYDCILMDIQMPGMDGLAATKAIRAQGYEKPIIALTAHALREEMEKSLVAGCNSHLSKPIQRTHLLETLQHFVQS